MKLHILLSTVVQAGETVKYGYCGRQVRTVLPSADYAGMLAPIDPFSICAECRSAWVNAEIANTKGKQ